MSEKITMSKGHINREITTNDIITSECITADYFDIYLFELVTAAELDAKVLQRVMWSSQPRIVEKMTALRDRLVKHLG